MATIEFSEEQTMLMDTAVDLPQAFANEIECAHRLIKARVLMPVWQEMIDLGWLGITVPEQYGGLGLSLADAVPIAESMGRHLMGFTLCGDHSGNPGADPTLARRKKSNGCRR